MHKCPNTCPVNLYRRSKANQIPIYSDAGREQSRHCKIQIGSEARRLAWSGRWDRYKKAPSITIRKGVLTADAHGPYRAFQCPSRGRGDARFPNEDPSYACIRRHAVLALLYLTIMLRRHNGLQIGKRVAVGRTEVWGAAGNRSHLIADISPKLVSTQRSAAIMPFLLFSFALQSMPSWLSGIISMTSLLFCVSKLLLFLQPFICSPYAREKRMVWLQHLQSMGAEEKKENISSNWLRIPFGTSWLSLELAVYRELAVYQRSRRID